MKAAQKIQGRRRSLHELYQETREFVRGQSSRWHSILRRDPSLGWKMFQLRGFTCFHSSKRVPVEERIHRGIVIGLHRPDGAFEYNMLEVEEAVFRRIPRGR